MKVALICSESWLEQERALLDRLLVGLIDQSIEVVLVMPTTGRQTADIALGPVEHLWYAPSSWDWVQSRRMGLLSSELANNGVDLIHMLDGSLQAPGLALAAELDVPLVCTVWSLREVSLLQPERHGTMTLYLPASKGLVEPCRLKIGQAAMIEPVGPGVYIKERPSQTAPQAMAAKALVVIGDGRLDVHYLSLLEGIAQSRRRCGEVLFFFCTTGTPQHELWAAAQRLDILDRISLAPGLQQARSLLLQADVLIQPQPLGLVRSVLIEAMAGHRVVLAAEESTVDYLIDGKTARLVRGPSASEWSAALTELTEDGGLSRRLCESAHKYALNNHKASLFVSHICRAYQQVAPSPLAFA